MTLPPFNNDGILPPGIWTCDGREFIDRFCQSDYRKPFAKAVEDVFDFATAKGALRVIVGGSFVTNAGTPADLDCVIVFQEENQIPDHTESLEIEATGLDIFFCSATQQKLLGAFVKMLSRNRRDREVGIVEVTLRSDAGLPLWMVIQEPDEPMLEIVKRVYFHRHIVDKNNRGKALITIHGIESYGEWNAEIAHIASSNGWIVAPFTYGYVGKSVFLDPKKRQGIVDAFRNHIFGIASRYSCDVSVIAHSMGTYIITKYLLGFDVPPVAVDTMILTGSILNEKLDLEKFRGRVAKIINEVAPNDGVVKYARPGSLWSDDLLGRSGETGFLLKSPRLEQHTSDIFDHNNVIRRDVIAQRWMPWLEAHVGLGREESLAVVTERLQGTQQNKPAK
jgi:hypothetical protein